MNDLANTKSILADSKAFRTHDLDEARSHIAELFCPHGLDVDGPAQVLDVCLGTAQIDGICMVYHRHGARVRVSTDMIRDFYLLQIPIQGEALIRINKVDYRSHPNQAALLSPNNDFEMLFGAGCEQLIVRVEQSELESHFERQQGRHVPTSFQFAPAIPLDTPGARQVIELLRFMVSALRDEQGICSTPTARKQVVSLLLSGFLTCFDHNHKDLLSAPSTRVRRSHMALAKEYIHEHLDEPITPDDIASFANMSTRSLFTAFQANLDTTPMRYVKDLRLERVRDALTKADPTAISVATVAMDHGFQHLGHFCADYKARFAERPSDTLHRPYIS